MVIAVAILFGWLVTAIEPACDSLFAQEPVKADLTEVESLKLVNSYQSAVLAQVAAQQAVIRQTQTRDSYNTLLEKLKADHKWPAATTFEINNENGKVTVHLPPTEAKPAPPAASPKSSQPPHDGTKENH